MNKNKDFLGVIFTLRVFEKAKDFVKFRETFVSSLHTSYLYV
jgi:hypothetical protein